MGWETRQRGGRYYTRSRRENGRIVREYVGGGFVGELAALTDATRRAERQAKISARRAAQEELATLDAEVEDACEVVQALMDGTLTAAGYHKRRGEWRRRRG